MTALPYDDGSLDTEIAARRARYEAAIARGQVSTCHAEFDAYFDALAWRDSPTRKIANLYAKRGPVLVDEWTEPHLVHARHYANEAEKLNA